MLAFRLLSVFVFAAVGAGVCSAAATRASVGVSATVVYNCAMDMSKLTAAQRKVVEDYCRKQNAPAQQQDGK